jgi:hypothetical protein
LVAGVAGSIAALAVVGALLFLFLIKRRKRRSELVGVDEDEMDQSEGVDATTFSSDEAFVSEYGFSERGGNSENGLSGEASDDEILVSEYGVSDGHRVSGGSEGAVEEMDESVGDEGESMGDDEGGE